MDALDVQGYLEFRAGQRLMTKGGAKFVYGLRDVDLEVTALQSLCCD
jgi:hypothetical protein